MREVFTQGSLFPEITLTNPKATSPARSGTFTANMKLPIHRWFRYSVGFSADWVRCEIKSYCDGDTLTVLDPFAGSATTLLAAESVKSIVISLSCLCYMSLGSLVMLLV